LSTAAWAQDAAQAVKERHEIMKDLWSNYYRGFAQVARGESTDVASIPQKASEASATIRHFVTLFPPGSSPDKFPETRAKPEIWSDRAGFEATANTLATETDRLGEAAKSGNVDAVKAQFAKVSQACGGCHGGPTKSGGKYRTEVQ
jgi:cytochrome c556